MDAATHSRYRALLLLVADPRRWTLLRELREAPRTVSDLVAGMEIAQPAVSHHLARLREAGLVDVSIEGRHRRYRWSVAAEGSAEAELQRLLDRWLVFDRPLAPHGRCAPAAREPIAVHLL